MSETRTSHDVVDKSPPKGVTDWSPVNNNATRRSTSITRSSSERWIPAAPCNCMAEACSCSHYVQQACLDWGRRFTMAKTILKRAPWPQKLIVILSTLQGIYLVCQQLPEFINVEKKYKEDRKEKGTKQASADLGVGNYRLLLIHTVIVAPAIVYFAVEAIVMDNAAELVAFIALSVLLTVRIITDEILIQNENTLGITFAVATVIFNGVYLILFLKTYTDLKRKRFLSIGPNPSLTYLFRWHQRFISVKKLDGLVVVVIVITMIFLTQLPGSNPTNLQLILVALLIVAEIGWMFVGTLAISKQDEYMLYLFWALSTSLPVFILTLATQAAFKGDDESFNEFHENPKDEQDPVRLATMVSIATVSLILRILTVYCSVVLYQNFGQDCTDMLGLVKKGIFIFEAYLRSPGDAAKAVEVSGNLVMELKRARGYTDEDHVRSTGSTFGGSVDLEKFEEVEQALRSPMSDMQRTHNPVYDPLNSDGKQACLRSDSVSSGGTGRADSKSTKVSWNRERKKSNERFLARLDGRSGFEK